MADILSKEIKTNDSSDDTVAPASIIIILSPKTKLTSVFNIDAVYQPHEKNKAYPHKKMSATATGALQPFQDAPENVNRDGVSCKDQNSLGPGSLVGNRAKT